jgi:L-seryl-tRNA(Ser) seleniumtransferase
MTTDARRRLPSVDAVVRAAGDVDLPRDRFVRAVRDVLAEARAAGTTLDGSSAADAARHRLRSRDRRSLRRVLNATGVVLQTNLGRAPLAPVALAAIVDAAGAVSVEYDLGAGRRGERHGHASRLLAELAGAEDGVVANNNARRGAPRARRARAARKEVIVARGELVEIGGGFRIPDVLRRSGAKLVEVGTTNRTYVRDYAAAITRRTGAILRVHASNFKLTGFVARPRPVAGRPRARARHRVHPRSRQRHVPRHVAFRPRARGDGGGGDRRGRDVVTFSGDKLLGGPQAGLAVGRAPRSARCARIRSCAPCVRTSSRSQRSSRRSSSTATVAPRAEHAGVADDRRDADGLAKRARAVAAQLASGGVESDVIETQSTIGGGSLPEETQPSRAVAIGARHGRANEIRRAAARRRSADRRAHRGRSSSPRSTQPRAER